jgi:excisionase family DNA binding protein
VTVSTNPLRRPWMKTKAVALLCDVSSETVRTWAKNGKLNPRRTPGGHLRFDPAEVDALLDGEASEPEAAA